MVMQLKNKSATEVYTVNWSNGTSTTLAASGVASVPVGISEVEVDRYVDSVKDVVVLCKDSETTSADLEAFYAATEGDDVQFTVSPATVTQILANSETIGSREVEIMVTNADGTRVSSFNDEVTLTLTTNSAAGTVLSFSDQADLTAGNSTKVASLYLRKGYGKCTINNGSGFISGETITLTVSQKTYFGVILSEATSVATIAAA